MRKQVYELVEIPRESLHEALFIEGCIVEEMLVAEHSWNWYAQKTFWCLVGALASFIPVAFFGFWGPLIFAPVLPALMAVGNFFIAVKKRREMRWWYRQGRIFNV